MEIQKQTYTFKETNFIKYSIHFKFFYQLQTYRF